MSDEDAHVGNGGEPASPSDPAKSQDPHESTTEEFKALLPDGAYDALGLDESANAPIYPDALDIGLADFDRTNPAAWASDWRLLAPPDSADFKDAVANPKDMSADDDANAVIDAVSKSLSQTD